MDVVLTWLRASVVGRGGGAYYYYYYYYFFDDDDDDCRYHHHHHQHETYKFLWSRLVHEGKISSALRCSSAAAEARQAVPVHGAM